jgi:hypothetical protein
MKSWRQNRSQSSMWKPDEIRQRRSEQVGEYFKFLGLKDREKDSDGYSDVRIIYYNNVNDYLILV